MIKIKWDEERLAKLNAINGMKKVARYFSIKEFVTDEVQKVIDEYESELDKIYDK